jgi:two-component system, NtrC family, sensor histidine kinase PilS
VSGRDRGEAPNGEVRAAAVRQRLALLMAARLVLLLAVLGVALLLTARFTGDEAERAERGLYTTVVLGFGATIGFAALYRRVRRPGRFGAVQLGADVALVTALVHFTGGSESIFAFLYVPITVCAALLFGRRGAYAAAGVAAVAFGALLLAEGTVLPSARGPGPAAVELARWGVHAGALLLVALLASALSRERDRAGRALDERTRDLRQLQRLHERTVASLTSGLLTTDAAGRITSFNPEAERITGLASTDVLDRPLGDVIPGAPELVLRPRERGGDHPRRARLPFARRDGRERHLGLAGSVLRAPDGEGGYVVIFQDVTRVVEMERELRRQERMAATGQLAAHLAHEIRNPLASMSGSIQMLASGGASIGEAERAQLMRIVLREVDRLDALIGDFLQYARPAPARLGAVSITEAVDEVLRMFESARPAGVEVAVEVPSELRARADGDQLRQLLWNLVLNAVQAMPEGGVLGLSAHAEPAQGAAGDGRSGEEGGSRWMEIRVSDGGTGIPEEIVEHIFDPFFTTKKDGTGLGLATVHRIVEGSGGHLTVESAVGRGTCFRIRLPLAEEVA